MKTVTLIDYTSGPTGDNLVEVSFLGYVRDEHTDYSAVIRRPNAEVLELVHPSRIVPFQPFPER